MRRWCIWCENGDSIPNHYAWIHLKCFEKMYDVVSDTQSIIKQLSEGESLLEIDAHLKRMQDFNRKWDNLERVLRGGE